MQKLLLASYIIILLYTPVLISFGSSALEEADFPIGLELEYREEFVLMNGPPGNVITIKYEVLFWSKMHQEVAVDVHRTINGATTQSTKNISYPDADSYLHLIAPLWLNVTNFQEDSVMVLGDETYDVYRSQVYTPAGEFDTLTFSSFADYGNITVGDDLHYHASNGIFLAGYKFLEDWINESNIYYWITELEFSNINSFGAFIESIDAMLISVVFVECLVIFVLAKIRLR
jgi:hypothetical protein